MERGRERERDQERQTDRQTGHACIRSLTSTYGPGDSLGRHRKDIERNGSPAAAVVLYMSQPTRNPTAHAYECVHLRRTI